MRRPFVLFFSAALTLSLCVACNDGGEKAKKPPPSGSVTDGKQPVAASSQPAAAAGGKDMAAAGDAAKAARVFWVMPKEGSKVPESFPVAFGVAGKTVTKAGEAMMDPSKGHHHVIVDGKAVALQTVVPKDETHIHYGGGQTSATLKLAPGKHTLTMQFADGAHKSFGDALSSTINIEVVKTEKPGKVLFVEPKDGAKIKGPVKMKFAAEGYKIRKAGEDPIEQISGHHHVIVDGKPIAAGTMVPKDEKHIHYGGGQQEAELTLAKGKHTLTLQLADGAHLSYGESMSQTISIEVE